MKEQIKQLIKKLPIAFTKNQQYDKQTNKVIKKVCSFNSCCIDVGAHKGEVLDTMLQYAPNGTHHAFEPIPDMYKNLVEKYAYLKNCNIHGLALSNTTGETSFNYVISNPSYSGLKKRKYDRPNEKDTIITVKTELLDNIIPETYNPTLIKIDVEGGELQVLEGAAKTIKRAKPTIIFEHGLGASDYYGSTPDKLFSLLRSYGLRISTMKRWLDYRPCLTEEEFVSLYKNNEEYYFIAYP
ncbi:MAG: FkbM family methyltransferase [Flavipsychrobacter sp.]